MIKRALSLTTIAFVCVLGLAVLIYWPGLAGPFILDDTSNIVPTQLDDPDWSSILYTVTHNQSGVLGRSVSIVSFLLTDWQFGTSPWGYKFHNLLLHLANALLIYRFLYVILPLLEPRIRSTNVALTAAVTTSFWLIHPLLVSTVLYAVQRMVELAVFFSLLALLSYFHARTRDTADLKFFIYGWILFPLMLLLAILSKETGVLVPVYILIIEFLVLKASLQSLNRKRHVGVWLMVFVCIPVIVAIVYLATHFDDFSDYSTRTFTLYERLLTQLHVIAFYVRMILIPRVKEMSLFQDDFAVTQSLDVYTLLLLAFMVLMLAAIWYLRYRAPVIAFGIAWFFASHLLESTFMPLELVFEHRNYFAAIGLLLPVVYYVLQIQKKELQALRWFIAVLFIIFVGQTFSRVQEWSDRGVLITVALNDHPNSTRVRTEYTNYLFSEGKKDEAFQQLMIAMDLNKKDAGSVIHQLVLLCLDGKRHNGLLAEAQQRLRTWPISAYGLNSITNLVSLINSKKCQQLILKDVETLVSAALTQPGNVEQSDTYTNLLAFMGMYRFTEAKYQEGVDLVTEAYEVSENIVMLSTLVGLQIQFKEYEDAEQTIAKMEIQNKRRFGTESYLVEQTKKNLSDALQKAASAEVEMQSQEVEEVLFN